MFGSLPADESIQSRFAFRLQVIQCRTWPRPHLLGRSRTGCFGPRPSVIDVYHAETENTPGFESIQFDSVYVLRLWKHPKNPCDFLLTVPHEYMKITIVFQMNRQFISSLMFNHIPLSFSSPEKMENPPLPSRQIMRTKGTKLAPCVSHLSRSVCRNLNAQP